MSPLPEVKSCFHFSGVNDYIFLSRSITFVAGEISTTIDLATIGGELDTAELNESLIISLTNPSIGVTLGEINTATITILDNDSMFILGNQIIINNIFCVVPVVEFSPSDYSTIEGNTIELSIVLDIPAVYSVFVSVNTEDGLSIGNYLRGVV